jgi:hypothetical protein
MPNKLSIEETAKKAEKTSEEILNVIVKNKCDTDVAIASLTYAMARVSFACMNPAAGVDATVNHLARAIRGGMVALQQDESKGGRGRN